MRINTVTLFVLSFLVFSLTGCGEPLTQKEIVQIAGKAAKARHLKPEEYIMTYDKDNAESANRINMMSMVGSGPFAKKLKAVKKKDYQAIIFKRKVPDENKRDYTFVVDRKTGKVLLVFKHKSK